MKKLYIILSLVVLCFLTTDCTKKTKIIVHNPVTAEGGRVSKADPNGPKIQFDETTYDFGTVMQGERLSHTFTFTNTGKSDLLISSATASCGCTTSQPPRTPIRPGEKGELKVQFDSKTKQGPVENTIRVAANTYPTRTVLTIKADVKVVE